ncbi:hypothetical protein BG46_17105 [Brucella anthropi]|nr:hypothetical protein BG46_17105 [Brucella anthropi]
MTFRPNARKCAIVGNGMRLAFLRKPRMSSNMWPTFSAHVPAASVVAAATRRPLRRPIQSASHRFRGRAPYGADAL